MKEQQPLERIADSLERIEKLIEPYFTHQTMPTKIVHMSDEQTKNSKLVERLIADGRKHKKKWWQ